jgi:uncharacterized protein
MLHRDKASHILNLLEHFPAIGVVGPRQVGKTTLVKEIAKKLQTETLYIDLESPTDYQRINNNPEWFLNENKGKTIIIDEVQQMLPLFPILRSAIDKDRRNGRFILLGSASPEFLAQSSESLAGRIAYIELKPLSIYEYNEQNVLWFRGGYPNALLAANDDIWQIWQSSFIKTYVERDLTNLGITANPRKINQMLYMLSGIHGSLLNVSNLSNSLKLDQRSVANYLDILEHAFLIRRLGSWYVNISKRLVKSPKIYIRDTGNLHYLLNLERSEDLSLNSMAGHSWEGFVIEQIESQLKENVKPYFYRTSNGAEVDLVLIKGIKPMASFEIKLSLNSSIGKGNTLSIRDLETKHNFIITPEGGDFKYNEDWMVCNLNEVKLHLKDLGLIENY